MPVISTDFYATILDLLEMNRPPQLHRIDGTSTVPLIRGGKEERIASRALFWHWPHYSNLGAESTGGAIRLGDLKLIEYFEDNTVQPPG